MNNFLEWLGLSQSLLLSILVAVAVFTTFMTIALPILSGNEFKNRMKAVALERDQMRARERARLSIERERSRGGLRQDAGKGLAVTVVNKLNLRHLLADDKTVRKLKVAGLRGQRQLTIFLFLRAALPGVLFAVTLLYLLGLGFLADKPLSLRLLICLGAALFGFYLPNIYVSNLAQKRRQSIQRAWPDALDLLLICVESGVSIEAAFRRVADEIGIQSVPLAEELALLCAELSFLSDRRAAFTNLSERTDQEGIQAVTTALIQAEKYGTPLSQAIRVLAQENRDMRMNAAEKKAASLPPKLTVPMIVFFLPVLFAVIIGPALIQIMHLG
ncbi:type II secretion system F family protein [Consotaella salsifontis]|uniref:Tight adherence protein C n=1 Tax=Consotaella salsifontis TaxID=1365950 RepID=A0A1T4S0D8_9HYPH|nr:type II secretion system F family protein [Consotaella salsifontis]SKA21750.1 tight adherence protein C [Consotaella salsifontis]